MAIQERKAIIVDVDNTIFSQDRRKAYILQEVLGRRDISLSDVQGDIHLSRVMRMLKDDEEARFWREFFSAGHYEDQGTLTVSCYDGCAANLRQLGSRFRVIYVTARPDVGDQREVLRTHLAQFDLPAPDASGNELHLMCAGPEGLPGTDDAFREQAGCFKKDLVAKLADDAAVCAGIGDSPEDIAAYSAANVCAIQFRPPGSGYERHFLSDLCFANWQEIAHAISLIAMEDNPLRDLRKSHMEEYATWLGDLDSKARTLLAIDTALMWAAMNWVSRQMNMSDWALLGGALCAVAAMVFAIRAFGSRRVRGSASGRSASLNGAAVRNLWLCLIGEKPVPPGSPIEDHELLKKATGSRKRLAHIQFFADNYGTLDPEAVLNLRLFELRALNYVKIYGEQWARRLTFLALFLLLIGIATARVVALPGAAKDGGSAKRAQRQSSAAPLERAGDPSPTRRLGQVGRRSSASPVEPAANPSPPRPSPVSRNGTGSRGS